MIHWFWNPFRRSAVEILREIEKTLPLKEGKISRFPIPTLTGHYFGFKITLEGAPKKGFHCLATMALPQNFRERLFLAHEARKTSLKPIASLKLVTVPHAAFNQNYLLLASRETFAQRVFQPYLCSKMTALPLGQEWQVDVHGETAHFELWQKRLNVSALCEVLKVIVECLNALLVSQEAGT